jgi:hypothetical protein
MDVARSSTARDPADLATKGCTSEVDSPFDLISNEILIMILGFLDDFPTRWVASLVCRQWNVVMINVLEFSRWNPSEGHLVHECATLGYTSLLKRAIQSDMYREPEMVFRLAVQHGHTPITDWLMTIWSGWELDWVETAYHAADNGNWKVLQWLWRNGVTAHAVDATHMVAACPLEDFREMTKHLEHSWAERNFTEWVRDAHVNAVWHNRLDVATWLLQRHGEQLHYKRKRYAEAMVDNGCVEMLRHVLRLPTHNGCVFEDAKFWNKVWEGANANGKAALVGECVRVMYWINVSKRLSGWSDEAIQRSGMGHFGIKSSIVRWKAIEYALRFGCLTVLDWVSTWTRVTSFGPYAYDLAIANKHVSVVHWLLEHKCPPANYLSGVDMQKWRTADDIPAAIYQKARVIVTLQI